MHQVAIVAKAAVILAAARRGPEGSRAVAG
ncbi:hypothetical protein FBY39_0038 [Microbacterium sp. SLBN-146]|nr:hypothetical protein FBY39_0038 [Microbacterium sp. SLBN-146]